MAKDKRHFNVLSLDTIINLYFVIIVFSISKLGKCQKKTVHAKKILSVPHFFHGQSSPPETLAQCAEATFFLFGRNCDLEFTQCGAGEEQKKHQGCINDE